MSDLIDRQIAISAICNACGKIDCDKMDKCEKLQLPPANNSEIPNSSDTISRAKAIEALKQQAETMSEWSNRYAEQRKGILTAVNIVEDLPPAQPESDSGRWERHYSRPGVYADLYWHCSKCGYKTDYQYANVSHHYCPNCGRKMEREVTE